ncbi:hypothetical protein ASF10_11290 [Flavobacterium sp. Leaf82]|uniref:GIY-YIG nuclease family protein n=1 Tax=unclassified Flavobacterium TaxID=196869 RepID=UPI0006F4210F|nr:GIY-YIG nuclease family protein [Flavobacterium sp. Leaf82]KQO22927.1 hypothetical protein ASF10_11290 [Flavobacterium sp. Leaf82]
MKDTDIVDRFNEVCFTLSSNDIFQFDRIDNGQINNVLTKLERHCFVVELIDDEIGLATRMAYINNDKKLKGDIICLNLDDQDYFQLLFRFCNMLTDNYDDLDTIDTFNTFQSQLRTFLEKTGFFTITSIEVQKFEGKELLFIGNPKRGFQKLELIDKVQFYRDFFNNNYKIAPLDGNDYVYLMINKDTSLIKIGTSKKPLYREKTLHSQEPKIHLIALWCCNKEIEKKLHKKYNDRRIRGEWFKLTLQNLKEIEDYMNFTNYNSLP